MRCLAYVHLVHGDACGRSALYHVYSCGQTFGSLGWRHVLPAAYKASVDVEYLYVAGLRTDASNAVRGGVVDTHRNVYVGCSARRKLHICLMHAYFIRVERHGERAARCRQCRGGELELALVGSAQCQSDRLHEVGSCHLHLLRHGVLALNGCEGETHCRRSDGAEVGAAVAHVVYIICGRVVAPARALETESHEEYVGNVLVAQVHMELLPLAALVSHVRHDHAVHRRHEHVAVGNVDVPQLKLVRLVVFEVVAAHAEREQL